MGACLSTGESFTNGASRKNKGQAQDTNALDLSQFDLCRVIGKGAFGKVKVVVHKSSGESYALKYIHKPTCIDRGAVNNIIRERKLLEPLDHPLICKMRYAFQDFDYLYIVSDLMLGGDLRFHIQRKTFTELAMRHWVAEIAAACVYCHSRSIIHRDIKPDNVMLTAEGHVKLVDFNISTVYRRTTPPRSRSGSLFYMAPEVHKGGPYDYAIDFWSIGVVLFECVYGNRPFNGKTNNDVARVVCDSAIELPTTNPPVTQACQDVICALVERDPKKRVRDLDALGSFEYFAGIDWSAINSGESPPVFEPGEERNFDASWELEEILLHDVPLDTRSRRPTTSRKRTTESSKERNANDAMELHFTDFDHTKTKETNILDLLPFSVATGESATEMPSRTSGPEGTGILDVEEKSAPPSVDAVSGSVGGVTQPQAGTDVPSGSSTETGPVKKSTSLFRFKSRKPVVLPPGVLSNKPRARVKVSG